MLQKIDLDGFRYQPGHFNIKSYIVERAIWKTVIRPENVIRMEAVTAVGRPAVEALSEPLVSEFGREVAQPSIKQMVGHMVRQVMEAVEYKVYRQRVRITRPGLFATGMTFRRPAQSRGRSVTVTAEHRQEWLNAAETDKFNSWLDGLVRGRDGVLDPDLLRQIAKEWNVEHTITWQDVKLNRLQLGIVLRPYVPAWYLEQNTQELHANSVDEEAEKSLGVDRRRH